MKSRTVLIGAYSAAALACIGLVVVLLQPWTVPATPPRSTGSVTAALQSRLSRPARSQAALAQIYQARGFSTVWFDGDRFSKDGLQVVALLKAAGSEALPAANYRVPAIPDPRAADAVKANFDLALTAAALRYAGDMRWGAWRPAQFFDDVNMPREKDDVAAGLIHAADGGDAAAYLRGLAPAVREYGLLRAALVRYSAIAAGGGWSEVTAEPRLSTQTREALKARLQAEGYVAANATPAATVAGLKAYQAASGLTADGRLNPRTADMLNVTAAVRVKQIAVNMERLRWMPHALGENYILVNVPDASLVLMEAGQATFVSRVVVGALDKQTPIFATKAVAVTINPAWHVPNSILVKEIQPKLDQDPDYLDSKNMEMRNGEVVQLPGPDNALGVAKFEMPNPFDVYLHDTPSKRGFLAEQRTLSHGCVRVEQIQALVQHVLGLEEDELQQLIGDGETQGRRLKQPIPVYIQYWTAITRDDGRTVFRKDVYDRDSRMIAAMFPGRAPVRLASAR